MRYLPIFLDVAERDCLVVGGGEVALRKATLLDRAGGRLIVVAPQVREDLAELVEQSDGELHRRRFRDEDLAGKALVIAATSDEGVNRHISALATERSLPVNVVDQPALCSFIVPAIVDRSPVVIAISTGGSSPVLTRRLKELIEQAVPATYGRLAALAGSFRKRVREVIGDERRRTRFWERLVDGPTSRLVSAGREEEARNWIEQELTRETVTDEPPKGEVYLVGAGPGDPDLLTLKALRLMYSADVVLYDRLVSPEILRKLRPDAEKIHVGKRRSHHPVPQESINELLVRLARQGRRVLRLKGGDPFIFGRGGEEIDLLAREGIAFQVVPGITAASGCASYAGIPLTHRDHAQSVRFVTGHLRDDRVDLDWPRLANENQTLVIYMGLVGLPVIAEQLIAHGMSDSLPVAVVQQGTQATQRVVTGTLETIARRVEEEAIEPPTITIIGHVVSLHGELAWFRPERDT